MYMKGEKKQLLVYTLHSQPVKVSVGGKATCFNDIYFSLNWCTFSSASLEGRGHQERLNVRNLKLYICKHLVRDFLWTNWATRSCSASRDVAQPRPDHQQIILHTYCYADTFQPELLLAWVYSAVAGITQWLTICSSQKAWFTTFLAFVLLFSFFPDCAAFFSPSSTWHGAAYMSCTVFLPLPVITGFTSSIFSQNVNSLFPFSYQLSHSYVRIVLFPACPVLDSHWR